MKSCPSLIGTLLLLSLLFTETISLAVQNQSCHGDSHYKLINRRNVLVNTIIVAGTGIIPFGSSTKPAFAATTNNNDDNRPVGIIGANGRTGALCVISCLQRGIPVRALTRTGNWNLPSSVASAVPESFVKDESSLSSNPLLTVQGCNVKDVNALNKGVSGCRGVIYAASASKLGGNPVEIDKLGVVAAANACIQTNVDRYVVISSTAVTRPKSLGYIFTDVTVNGIMGEKKKGEDGVIAAYQNYNVSSSSSSSCKYCILRPGGLEEPKKNIVLGPSAIELSQGDVLAGIISRADLGEVAVELALDNKLPNTSLEVYYTDSVQPCEGKFKKYLTNGLVPRLHGNSYQELFDGIKADGEYLVP